MPTYKELLCVKALKRYRHDAISADWGGGFVGMVFAFIDSLFIRTPPIEERKNIRQLWWTYGSLLPRGASEIEAILEVARILYGADTIEALNPEALVDSLRKEYAEARMSSACAVAAGHFRSIRVMDVEGRLLRALGALLPSYES